MSKIKLKKNDGPITIEVNGGYATLGVFVLAYCKKNDYNFIEFGRDPKRIDDDIEDIHPIPLDIDQIENFKIVILGKYRPVPTKEIIRVYYKFIQNNKVIHEEKINEVTNGTKRFTNWFEFEHK